VEAIARSGNALIGRSRGLNVELIPVAAGGTAFEVDANCASGSGDGSGISTGGLVGNGFSAPGEVRYVISCKHLSRVGV